VKEIIQSMLNQV